jgi:hypothetical protein
MSAAGPGSSRRFIEEAIVAAIIRKASVVCSRDQVRAARNSRMAIRLAGGYCGRRCGSMRAMRTSFAWFCWRGRVISWWTRSGLALSRMRVLMSLAAQLQVQAAAN